jgi:hypothetical protein
LAAFEVITEGSGGIEGRPAAIDLQEYLLHHVLGFTAILQHTMGNAMHQVLIPGY